MRLLFFILLLGNAIAFGYLMQDNAKPVLKAHAEIKPEAIRLQSKLSEDTKATGDAAKHVCMEWSGLTDANFQKAQSALEALGLKEHLVLPSDSDFWVHIPPLKNMQDAEKKLSELRAFGVEDGRIVEEAGKWRYAITLAAFGSKEEAEFYLKQLRDKNIRSAKILERHPASISLTLLDLDPVMTKQLQDTAAGFDKSDLKPVACNAH